MPLNRPALSLGSGPRGVQEARRWVVGCFREIGREDLSECAEIAISELVTNALLHGTPPIVLRVRGTHEHPRIEVHDASNEVPDVDSEVGADGADKVLLTFGRGLSIVARASEAWGAEVEHDGKVVWFTPAAEFSEQIGPHGSITVVDPSLIDPTSLDPTDEHPHDLATFRLLGVPVKDYLSFQNHSRELRREARLLTLANESDYPLASDLSDIFGRLGRPLTLAAGSPDIEAARALGRHITDLNVVMTRRATVGIERFIELLELTDAFCREEKMLTLARTPAERDFQNWFLGEFVRQGRGLAPLAWAASPTSPPESGRRHPVS